MKGLDVVDEDGQVYLHVNVLDVDSVKQVKKKVLDCAWRKGYCLQPRDVDAVDLGENIMDIISSLHQMERKRAT